MFGGLLLGQAHEELKVVDSSDAWVRHFDDFLRTIALGEESMVRVERAESDEEPLAICIFGLQPVDQAPVDHPLVLGVQLLDASLQDLDKRCLDFFPWWRRRTWPHN